MFSLQVVKQIHTKRSCNGDQPVMIDGSMSGSLESPNYPGHYYSNMMCSWMIKTNSSSAIKLTFEDISIEGSDPSCP